MLDAIEQGFNATLGIELVSAQKDRVVGRLVADERHVTGGGRIHGGLLMALADAVAAHGAIGNLPEGAGTTTIESKTNFLRGARPGPLLADAVPVHIGRTTMVWTTTIRDEDANVLAIVTQTQLVLAGEASAEGDADRGEASARPQPERGGTAVADEQAVSTADKRRAQILQAAFSVIAKKGFANASIREIAAAASMPVPTMYQYMRSKDEILAAIFEDYLGSIEASMQRATVGETSATDKLRSAVTVNLEEFDRHQIRIRMMNRETAALRADVRARVKDQMLGYIGLFREIVQDGVRSGEFRPVQPELVANLVAMLCEVWPLRQWALGDRSMGGVRDGIIDLVLNGLTETRRLPA